MRGLKQLATMGLGFFLGVSVFLFGWTAASAQRDNQAQVEEGARLYAENCAVCHGEDGQGRVGATLAKDWPSIRPDLQVQTTIENGVAGSPMPAWSQANGGPLSSAEIEAIAAYILTWETGGPREILPLPTPRPRPLLTAVPEVEGNPNQGAILYDQNCAVCHGENGEGRIGATLAKSWPSIRPDLRMKATISNGVTGSPMPAWLQANGGPLKEEQVNDLVAFLLTMGETSIQVEAPEAEIPGAISIAWLTGWGGVLVLLGLFAAIVALALVVQSRRPPQ